MAFSLVTWNINSVRLRLKNLGRLAAQLAPDVICLQETKTPDEFFPREAVAKLGYKHILIHGMKAYNGVAILSRTPATDVVAVLPGDGTDEQARYIEATVGDLRVASVYLPNGNPAPGDKFDYKLAWMKRLRAHAQNLLDRELPFALAGDFNVAPNDDDVYDPAGWKDDALCRPESRTQFRALLNLGIVDAFRALHAEGQRYTYWDYMQRRFETDHGLRIDHVLLSPQATDRLRQCDIDKSPRSRDKPSDHTPIWCEIAAP